MNIDKLSVVVAEFVVEGWIVLRLGKGGNYLLHKKYIRNKKKWEGKEEGWLSCHKLNISDGITDIIISSITPLVILLVKIWCHHMIYLIKFHCNILCHSISTYRENFSICIYRWIHGWKILSVKVIAIYQRNFFIGVSVCIC